MRREGLMDAVSQLLLSIAATLQPRHEVGQLCHIIEAPACAFSLLHKELRPTCWVHSCQVSMMSSPGCYIKEALRPPKPS